MGVGGGRSLREMEDRERGEGESTVDPALAPQMRECGVWVSGDLGVLSQPWKRRDPVTFPQISGLLGLFSEVLNSLEEWHPWPPSLA